MTLFGRAYSFAANFGSASTLDAGPNVGAACDCGLLGCTARQAGHGSMSKALPLHNLRT